MEIFKNKWTWIILAAIVLVYGIVVKGWFGLVKPKTVDTTATPNANQRLIGHYCCDSGYELIGGLCKDGFGHSKTPKVCIDNATNV